MVTDSPVRASATAATRLPANRIDSGVACCAPSQKSKARA